MEVWRENRVLYEGRIIRLRVGDVALDDGSIGYREVVEHPGGVCVLPWTGHSVLLVRQYRIALGEYVLEAPAGKIEGNEDPEYRGRRELEEETGYRARTVIPLGYIFASVGYSSERIHLYLAFDLEKTARNLDPEERIELVEMPLQEVMRMLDAGEFPDGKTVVLLHALIRHLEKTDR